MNSFPHFAALALLAALALPLAGCAAHAPKPDAAPNAPDIGSAAKQSVPAPKPMHAPTSVLVDDPPLTLYPILDGTPLLETPAPQAPMLELMAAESRVIRFRLQGGWARVLDPASGRIGWMENRLLTPRAPAHTQTPGKGSISETF